MASQDELLADLRGRIARKEIRVLAGAGVAMATTGSALSWTDTLCSALEFLGGRKTVDPGWVRQEMSDLAGAAAVDLLIRAEQITSRLQRNHDDWAQWLKIQFGDLKPDRPALIAAMLDLGLDILTTNFDDLIV